MDCYIDINLVDFEIMFGAFAGIWSSKRLLKITQLLRAPQAILFQRLNGTGEIIWRLNEFWVSRRRYFSIPLYSRDVNSSTDVVVPLIASLLVVLDNVRLGSISNDQDKTASFPF